MNLWNLPVSFFFYRFFSELVPLVGTTACTDSILGYLHWVIEMASAGY